MGTDSHNENEQIQQGLDQGISESNFSARSHEKRSFLNILGAVALLAASSCEAALSAKSDPKGASTQAIRLNLKWYHQFQFAGYYAAQAKGFYKQEGLNVQITQGDAVRTPVREVLSGRADFGVSDAEILKTFLEGKPIVVLASVFQHSPYILLMRADSGIRVPTDLRGKKVMLANEHGDVQLLAVFQREGMSIKDIQVVPHRWDDDALIKREVDAMSAYSTVEPLRLRSKGVETSAIRAMDYGVDFYGDTLFTTQLMIKNHPAEVAAFRRASLKGWEYAMAHPEEIIDLIVKLPGVQERGTTREMLQHEAEAMRALLGFVEPGDMNTGRWQAIARTYAEVGIIDRVPSEEQLAKFIYVAPRITHDPWLKPLLISLGIVVVVGGWILLWNVQLRRSVARRTAALQKAQQELVYHVENSPLGVIEWDNKFHVKRWTGQAEQLFGWKASDLIGKHPNQWRFVHEEDLALGQKAMERLLSGREKRNMIRNRNYRKDGSVLECEWYNSSSIDETGRVRTVFSLVLDVTARVRAEKALRESEEKFRAVFEQAAIGIGRVDFGNACWVDANEAFCKMLGYTREEMLRTTWPDMTHPEDLDIDLIPFHRMASGELESYSVEKRFIHKDGRHVWARLALSAVRDIQGEPSYEVAVIEDITERKHAEEALRASEKHLRVALDAGRMGTWVWDPETDLVATDKMHRAIWDLNPDQVQYEAGEILSRVHPDDRDILVTPQQASTREGPSDYEFRILRRDGGLRWLHGSAISLRDGHSPVPKLIGVNFDITQQKQAQEKLAQVNQELEERVDQRTSELRRTISELEQMSYSMVHDLRAPLRAIESFGTIVAEDPNNRLTEESRKLISKMRAATDRMDHLVRDMLNYSRVVRRELPLGPVDVGALIEGILATYPQFHIAAAMVEVQPDLPVIRANPAGLTQCLSQLLSNAVKFTRPDHPPRVQVTGERCGGGKVRIVVQDNGVGIPPELREKLFGMYQQLRNTGQGTGMGLALVKKAVERMGGHVGVESEPGKGSRFWLELKEPEQGDLESILSRNHDSEAANAGRAITEPRQETP